MNREELVRMVSRATELRAEIARLSDLREELLQLETTLHSNTGDFYETLAEQLPAEHFVFMNHGYYDEEASPDEEALHNGFHPVHRYSVEFLRFLLRGVNVRGKQVLEVGSGRGGNCVYLARHTGAKSVDGVDLGRGNIEFCKRVHLWPNLTFTQASAEALPFSEQAFDVVINLESSHSYPCLSRFFAEVLRVLRPGGDFLYSDVVLAEAEEIHGKALRASGFEILDFKDITSNVMAAMEKNRNDLDAYYRSMIDPDLGNEAVVQRMIHGLNVTVHDLYKTGKAVYKFWRMRAPG